MLFGVHYGPQADTMNIADLARAAEDLGFESLFVSEHTHVPVTLHIPRRGGPPPPGHSRGLDPWIALTAAASATSRLRLGTAVCLVTERDPIVLAREIATLDVLSAGRVILGAGVGSLADETRNHGVEPQDRWQVMAERIRAMKEIWTHDEAEFHGRFVNFDPIYQWPKPVQKPHPPVYIGGGGEHVLSRVVAYGDGWMPTFATAGEFLERVARLQVLASEKGRQPIPVSASGAPADPSVIESFQKAGVARCLLSVPSAGADEVLPVLKSYTALIQSFA